MTAKDFADDQVVELLERISIGESILKVCADPRMPARSTLYSWIENDGEFAGQFRAARARGVHALADQCLDIADEPTNDPVQVANKRVRIDTRLRLAGKWLPKEYGEKLDVNHSGEVVNRHDLTGYSADELDALEKLIGKAADASGDTGGTGAAQSGALH